MALHVSLVPDEFTKVQLLLLTNGRPMLAVSDARAGLTVTVDENPAAAAQAVLLARELVTVAAQFADQCQRYAAYIAQQYEQQQEQQTPGPPRHELAEPE